MKKIFALILILILALSLFACGEIVSSPSSQEGIGTETDGTDFSSLESAAVSDSDVADTQSTQTSQVVTLLPGEVSLSVVATVNHVSAEGLLLEQNGRWYYFAYEKASSFCVGDRVHVTYASSPETVHSGIPHTDAMGTERLCVTFDKVLSCAPMADGGIPAAKPVIYLYPEAETEIFVRVDFQGVFTATIPDHGDGWTVTASPDGTLTVNGQTYPYLFWEGIAYDVTMPMDTGYCVAGGEVEAFFADVLLRMGLTEGEAADFMEFWVPRMEENAYNIISFQTDAYEAIAPLTVFPAPDAVLRIFMTYSVAEEPLDLPAPEILPFERKGFTLVEWGGGEV